MKLGYDPGKNEWNIRERGLSFDDVASLDWDLAVVRKDERKDYGEDRFQAFVEGEGGKAYVVVFTWRGEMMWVISFRRAHEIERRLWRKNLTPS